MFTHVNPVKKFFARLISLFLFTSTVYIAQVNFDFIPTITISIVSVWVFQKLYEYLMS